MNDNQYISIDPDILRGKPCVTGTRISVEFILELLSLGYTVSDILNDYPQLTQKQILSVLDFACKRIRYYFCISCVNGRGLDNQNIR